MNVTDMVALSVVGTIVAWVLGCILFVLVWYWIIRLAVTHAIRVTDEERELREKQRVKRAHGSGQF